MESKRIDKFRKNRAATLSLSFLSILFILLILSPLWQNIFLQNPDIQNLPGKLAPPSLSHPFGTDALGRDLLARVVAGAHTSLLVGFVATLITVIIGVIYGSVAGYNGGKIDSVLMRIVDVLYTLPYIFLVILLLGLFNRSLMLLFAALGAVQWLTMARMVRGEVMAIKSRDFIAAAVASGASPLRLLIYHFLPNISGVVIVYATLTVPVVMLQEAFLSFLGLTVPGQEHSWGVLISEGLDAVNPVKIRWWLITFPGAAISLTLLALNFLGDGLRDAFDPKNGEN